ncbi:hypothetical protein LTR10_011838 [Elasticomyces elasticus]|nr:hypothetical protein LTR10_011838 [Elasticomyces elasticus]KAK4968783.1 hypothetical protein LTR42_009060 [Elasticomyces elasticus]
MPSKPPSTSALVPSLHDGLPTAPYTLTLRRVWDDEEPSHVTVEGTEDLLKVLHASSDLCKVEELSFTEESEARPAQHCIIRIEPFDCPVVFGAKPFLDGRKSPVADQDCIYIGVAEITAREKVDSPLSCLYVLSLHKSSMLWHVLLNPRDPSTAYGNPQHRCGLLKDRILFASAQVLDGGHHTMLTLKETCKLGIVFGQPKQDMEVEWEYELEEDTFQEMLHRLEQKPMTWMFGETMSQKAFEMLKSSQGDPLEFNTKTVRQFSNRLTKHGFGYKLPMPVTKDESIDALACLGPFSPVCDVSKLRAMAMCKASIRNLNNTNGTFDAHGTRILGSIRTGFYFRKGDSNAGPVITAHGTPITYLRPPFMQVVVGIDGADRTFVVFPFASIMRNNVGTRHIVAKDIISDTYLAICEEEAGDAHSSEPEEEGAEEHDAGFSDEYVEEYDEERGGRNGKDYTPKGRSDHGHKHTVPRDDED